MHRSRASHWSARKSRLLDGMKATVSHDARTKFDSTTAVRSRYGLSEVLLMTSRDPRDMITAKHEWIGTA